MSLFELKRQQIPSNILNNRFGWSPFSILNTMSWDWRRRVDEWETIIKDSGAGRDVKRYNATPTNIFSACGADKKEAESTSIFDPYLSELMYRWFSIEGASILDPFAGGSVRGIVASVLGRHYEGIDLSKEQVDENIRQYNEMMNKYDGVKGIAHWTCGDSNNVLNTWDKSAYDMIFTCPPYYNLERYTRNPLDLSCMPTYSDFLHKYSSILQKATRCLHDDSFLVIVVSEVRAFSVDVAHSEYAGLVPDTVHILRDECSLQYYNEIILENSLGSLPIRTPKSFDKTRKIGRHHQNILVFYKGNIAHIEEKFGKVNF